MSRVLSLKYTATLVCVLHTLNSSHLSSWLQQQDGEEEVLELLLQMHPHRVMGEMVKALAPQHLKNLQLAKCIKLMPQDLLEIQERCKHLQQLSLKDCDQLEMGEVVSLCASRLSHLASLNLTSCISLNDQNVQTILKETASLRHLSVANTNITDAAFFINPGKQLSLEVLSKKSLQRLEVKHMYALVSLDVSGCSQLSSTGVRHLCSLTGATLRSLNISWTGVDFVALLYLSGLSLPAAVQFMLDTETSLGADAGILSGLCQELSNFHSICRHLEVFETETGTNCLHAFEKSEQDDGESEGSRITEGQVAPVGSVTPEGQMTSGGHVIHERHAVSQEHLTPEGEMIADKQVIFEKTVVSEVHTISERQVLHEGLLSSDQPVGPEGQVRSGDQSVASSTSAATDISFCSSSRLKNVVEKSDQKCVSDKSADDRLHPVQLCSSVLIEKCIPCTTGFHKGENSNLFTVPGARNESVPTKLSGSENQMLSEGRRRGENTDELREASLFPLDDVSPTDLPVDVEEKPADAAAGVGPRSSKINLHHTSSQFSAAFDEGFLMAEKSEENEDARIGSFLRCSSSCHPCVSDGLGVPASSPGQAEFELGTSPGSTTPLETIVFANAFSKDQEADGITERRNEVTLAEDSFDDQKTEQRLGDDIRTDISKTEESSPSIATDAAMSKMFSARTSTVETKSDGLSTVIEMKNLTRSPMMGATFGETVTDARCEVTDLTDLEPMFVPRLQHLRLSSSCLEGRGDTSLGVACLDRCLSANCAMSSLAILCVENSLDMNTVVEVVTHRLPCLKELTVDSAETLANSSVFHLVSTCKHLTKVDLTGACFLTDAALLPLSANNHVEELLLSETCISHPFLVAIGSIANNLRVLDLAWCNNIEEESLNMVLRHCTQLTHLNLRQCPVSDHTVEIMAAHCKQLTSLGLSCVTDISDAAVVTLAGCLEHLQSVDFSWNSDLTDVSISALLVSCPRLQTADLTGLKRITSAPFLPIIADLDRWRRCQALIRYKLLVQKATAPTADLDSSDEEPEDLFLPQRSTSYATCLRSLLLHYSDCVCDRHLQEIVAVCQGSLAIVDYYGELVEPVLFSARARQEYLSPR